MWCDKHARWCAHTTDACTLGTKGGKAGKGGPRQHLDTRTPYYPTAPVYPPGAGPYGISQDEKEIRRIREVLAETVPEKAPEIYQKLCTPGLVVEFTRDARDVDMTELRRGFPSVLYCYRTGRWLFAGFAHPAERDSVVSQLQGATDRQGATPAPLVVTLIDDPTTSGQEVVANVGFSFGAPTPPEGIALPHTPMEESGSLTQPAQSPAKRPRTDDQINLITDTDDALDKRISGIDIRITTEVGKLKSDIDTMSHKIDSIANSIRDLPRAIPAPPAIYLCKNRTPKSIVPEHKMENGAIFWVVARRDLFDQWRPYKMEIIGVAKEPDTQEMCRGALFDEEGKKGWGLIQGPKDILWDEPDATNEALNLGE